MVEKDQDLTTIFICFLKAGFRFTRNDTNIVGLRFAEELRKDNPDFKPVKIEQREFTKHFVVNGYPRAFEPVILDLVLEYGKEHKLEYRAKKSGQSGRRGGFQSGQNRQRRSQSYYSSDRSGSSRSFEGNRSDYHSGESHDAKSFRSDRSGEHRPRRRRIYRTGDGNQGKPGPGDNT